MLTKVIQTPPCTPEQEAKLKRFFQTMSEFMKVEINFSTRTIMVIEIPLEHKAAITVITQVLKNLEKDNSNKPESPTA